MLTFLIVSEVAAVLSVVPSASAEDSTKTLLRMLVVALLLTCAVSEPEGDFSRARRTAQALVVGGLLLAATGWGLWFGGFQTHWGGLVGPLHYNEICMVLVPILSLAFAFLVTKPSWWRILVCTVMLTLNDRFDYAWKPALRLISERPLFGWGFGTSTFAHLTLGDGPLLGHEHNAVLAVAVQSGLVGVAAWSAWLAVLLWREWLSRRLDERDPRRWLLIDVAIAVVAEYLVQGLGEPVGNYRMGVLLVVLSGIVVLADGPPVSWLKPGE